MGSVGSNTLIYQEQPIVLDNIILKLIKLETTTSENFMRLQIDEP